MKGTANTDVRRNNGNLSIFHSNRIEESVSANTKETNTIKMDK